MRQLKKSIQQATVLQDLKKEAYEKKKIVLKEKEKVLKEINQTLKNR